MPVPRIRLALHGCLNRPFYHIVVATNTSKRDGKHLEQVGCYDPMPNYNQEIVVGLNTERIKYWLSVGARPTVAVDKLLGMVSIPRLPSAREESLGMRLLPRVVIIQNTIDLEESSTRLHDLASSMFQRLGSEADNYSLPGWIRKNSLFYEAGLVPPTPRLYLEAARRRAEHFSNLTTTAESANTGETSSDSESSSEGSSSDSESSSSDSSSSDTESVKPN